MLVLQDCISKLSEFKQTFGNQFGITRLGIFGSVARQENTEDSDIDIVDSVFSVLWPDRKIQRIVILTLLWKWRNRRYL